MEFSIKQYNVVTHLATCIHIINDHVEDPLDEFRKVNVEGTLNLARQTAEEEVKRFIFISTIKADGESTQIDLPFTADDEPAPEYLYVISKH